VCGGNHGAIDIACRPIRDAASKGQDARTALLFDSWIAVAQQVARHAMIDEQAGHRLSVGSKRARPAGCFLSAERMHSRDDARRRAACE
jgi:hypothetical protein